MNQPVCGAGEDAARGFDGLVDTAGRLQQKIHRTMTDRLPAEYTLGSG